MALLSTAVVLTAAGFGPGALGMLAPPASAADGASTIIATSSSAPLEIEPTTTTIPITIADCTTELSGALPDGLVLQVGSCVHLWIYVDRLDRATGRCMFLGAYSSQPSTYRGEFSAELVSVDGAADCSTMDILYEGTVIEAWAIVRGSEPARNRDLDASYFVVLALVHLFVVHQ